MISQSPKHHSQQITRDVKSFGLKNYITIFIVYFLLHCSVFSLHQLATDDYLQKIYATGSSQLASLGLLDGLKTADAQFFINNQFNFFDPQLGNNKAMQAYGSLPWWTKSTSSLHLWRPLSSITHWLDYQLFPQSPYLMHVHNGLWLFVSFALVVLLYRALLPSTVLLLAIIIYAVDVSVAPVVGWIAARNSLLVLTFLPLCLYFLHKATIAKPYYGMALLFYVLALLSAEAGIVVLAYVVSYLCLVNNNKLLSRIVLALPFIVITVVWRAYYHAQGYGSVGISQYLDPAMGFSVFFQHAIVQFPLLFLEVITGIDSLEVIFNPSAITILQYLGWFLLFTVLYVCVVLRAKYSHILFWYVSFVLSLAPGLVMYSTDPRIVIYAHIGFAVVAACILLECWHRFQISKSIIRWAFFLSASLIVILHLVVQLLAMVAVNYAVLATTALDPNKEYAAIYGFSALINKHDHAVLINHPDAFRLMYYPYLAEDEGFVLPQTLRQISYAQNTIHIQRLDESSYRIMPEGGFILHPNDLQINDKAATTVNSLRYAVFFDNGSYDFSVGEVINFPELSLKIQQVDQQHRPLVIDMTLLNANHTKLLYWDMPSKSFQLLPKLSVGETFRIKGFN